MVEEIAIDIALLMKSILTVMLGVAIFLAFIPLGVVLVALWAAGQINMKFTKSYTETGKRVDSYAGVYEQRNLTGV